MHHLESNQLPNQKLISLVGVILFPLFSLFRFIHSYFFRYRISEEYDEKELDFFDAIAEPEEDELKKKFLEYSHDSLNEEKEDEKDMIFTFKFPRYEEIISNRKEIDENISQIEGKSVKEDETFNYFAENRGKADHDDKILIFNEFHSEIDLKKDENFSSSRNQVTEDSKNIDSVEDKDAFFREYLSYIDMKREVKDDHVSEINVEVKNHGVLDEEDTRKPDQDDLKSWGFSSEGICCSEKDSLFTSSDTDSTGFEQVHSVMSFLIDSYSEGFLSEDDFGKEPEPYYDNPVYIDGKGIDFHGDEMSELGEEHWETEEFDDEEEDVGVEEFDGLKLGFLTEKDFDIDYDDGKGNGEKDYDDGKGNGEKDYDSSSEGNKMESLWEHQDLIEQLKMELKKVRASGLPTILEESESPKIMDDLKPWKIEEKFHHEDFLGELHKVYKSYYGRMRKFDILTYQKMYTIGFLHLKDPFQSTSSEKSSGPTFKSLLSENSWLLKNKTIDSTGDPMMTFMKELKSDFEVVYVGQMCISWEFLHWQYFKALDLSESDPHGIRRYNEVADEFQQFQVLIQRFLEDEQFQGPRMQYFIKSRCVLRSLLHVPVIREDGSKDKRRARNSGSSENIITSDMLVNILEQSIRIFWRFIQADKDCSSESFKGKKGKFMEHLQNPKDHELLMEVRNGLQKKNRKLKEILRGKSCILRRFKKGWEEEEDTDPALYFFSQVDMKLVSRALNMSKLTSEQLDWCRNKLNGINFVGRKMHVESSFLLFPC